MYAIKAFSDIFTDACVRDDEGNLLFASLYGRDGALLQFFAAFSLQREEGGIDAFTVYDETEEHLIRVPNPDTLEKLSGRFPKENLFGNLAHAWVYNPKLVKRDYANRTAWIIQAIQENPADLQHRAWHVLCDLSPVPLLEQWQTTVMGNMGGCLEPFSDFLYPPIGNITGFKIHLDNRFTDWVSNAVRAGVLEVDATSESQQDSPAPPSIFLTLGQIVMTPGVAEFLAKDRGLARRCIQKHQRGDWGCIGESDRRLNDQAVKNGSRVLSAYPIDENTPCTGHGANTLWIITEADRSVTTLLLPSEY